MSPTLEILKLFILACQVNYTSSGPGFSYEFIQAKQASCQRMLVKCAQHLASEHRGVMSEYDAVICLSGDK